MNGRVLKELFLGDWVSEMEVTGATVDSMLARNQIPLASHVRLDNEEEKRLFRQGRYCPGLRVIPSALT